MAASLTLETPRLILRPWEERDLAPFAEMNSDPGVMRFYPALINADESNEAVDRYRAALERDGFAFLAAEERSTGRFAGTIGMQTMRDVIPGLAQPAVEIGWRLNTASQGKGYATEAALAVMDFGFAQTHLHEIVAITVPVNTPSRRVMEKLGMTLQPQLEFDHPRVPAGHPYVRHVLYRMTANEYRQRQARALSAELLTR